MHFIAKCIPFMNELIHLQSIERCVSDPIDYAKNMGAVLWEKAMQKVTRIIYCFPLFTKLVL